MSAIKACEAQEFGEGKREPVDDLAQREKRERKRET